MTYNNMLNILESWGFKLKTSEYFGFKQYCRNMIDRQRMIIMTEDRNIVGFLFFFITNDYTTLYKKGEWETPQDINNGTQMYIDKMICKKWTLYTRRLIQDVIENTFPSVEIAVYHRAPKDRCVIINRRRQLCTK